MPSISTSIIDATCCALQYNLTKIYNQTCVANTLLPLIGNSPYWYL